MPGVYPGGFTLALGSLWHVAQHPQGGERQSWLPWQEEPACLSRASHPMHCLSSACPLTFPGEGDSLFPFPGAGKSLLPTVFYHPKTCFITPKPCGTAPVTETVWWGVKDRWAQCHHGQGWPKLGHEITAHSFAVPWRAPGRLGASVFTTSSRISQPLLRCRMSLEIGLTSCLQKPRKISC